MNLIINDNIIEEPIENIIYELKREANWLVFKDIQNKGAWIRVTCPFHKDGTEEHPSASIYTSYDSDTIIPGTFHCFTCGTKYQLYQVVALVLGISNDEAKEWLVNKFGKLYVEKEYLDLNIKPPEIIPKTYMDPTILEEYKYYHPYLQQRKVPLEIAKKFSIGYNKKRDTITFPVWDVYDNLAMITERSVTGKKFYIQTGIEKPVYLLNYALKEKANTVIVCEGQFDALVAWSYGFPAVALFGAGTTNYQLEELKKSHINNFILMYDNDLAGQSGAAKFMKSMKNAFVTNIIMPKDRDIADLTKEEFLNLLNINKISLK